MQPPVAELRTGPAALADLILAVDGVARVEARARAATMPEAEAEEYFEANKQAWARYREYLASASRRTARNTSACAVPKSARFDWTEPRLDALRRAVAENGAPSGDPCKHEREWAAIAAVVGEGCTKEIAKAYAYYSGIVEAEEVIVYAYDKQYPLTLPTSVVSALPNSTEFGNAAKTFLEKQSNETLLDFARLLYNFNVPSKGTRGPLVECLVLSKFPNVDPRDHVDVKPRSTERTRRKIMVALFKARGASQTMMCESGQEKGDSTSLQHECSARARFGKSTHASRPFREMIARPKISRNERKTTEIKAFEVGNFAPFSCPGPLRTA